jgi:hypothetical protein
LIGNINSFGDHSLTRNYFLSIQDNYITGEAIGEHGARGIENQFIIL